MKYKSINEFDKFDYKDCYIEELTNDDNNISLTVEALIVRANNSNNTNYTDSYAGTTQIIFNDAKLIKVIKLGFKRYDADDRLLESVEDAETKLGLKELKGILKNAYLTAMIATEDNQTKIMVELADEDPCAITDEYEIYIDSNEVTISWDKYLNRVQQM